MLSKLIQAIWTILKIIGYYLLALWHKLFPPKPKDISGKLVLVTGGRRGLGQALALEFAKHGANIVLWDIDQVETEQTADDIRCATGVKVRSYVCDVSDFNKIKATAAQVKREMGKVDILVNNAGIMYYGKLLDKKEDEFIQTFNVNVMSHFWTLRQFLPDMLDSGEGHILATASIVGYLGIQNIMDYCTSKHAVLGLYESLEREVKVNYGCSGIKVSVLCPGGVDTPLFREMFQKSKRKRKPGDAVSPEYVAQLAVDGVLRNQRLIFAPPVLSVLRYCQVLLPKRAREILSEVMTPKPDTDH